ncbi:PilT/PilU family type 4a pilus ATPase [Casimicrobium huifangae]|jgi:twitching motility protein PilU|uniref:PilT/PilU family type 4a pilus ATPase n=1 Tax=Casimicrobium huifangae TaxID=2591109 RepID=UPI0012EBBDA0|nr:PilT/PilU family type 4a pilus ATPase [Casimicrobium huifangae]
MYLTRLLQLMSEREASDLFISAGAPIHLKINNDTLPVSTQIIDAATAKKIAYEVMNEEEIARFERDWEMNLSHIEPEFGNFRVNILKQRGSVSMVVRYIRSNIPSFASLNLPPVLLDLALEKRGLILMVGSTGSGKSTSLSAMIDHRNSSTTGHILTVEDPIEYLLRHKRCVVNQREVGHDTRSYENALANALREAPDLLLIGEVRDRATMQHALTHALTGNLCLTTLHATNSYHALSRIINMYPQDARSGLLADLSYGLKAIIGQRLVKTKNGSLQPAVEVLINTKLVAEFIAAGEMHKIKEAMEQSLTPGSCTFEQALAKLYLAGTIDYEQALSASDSPTNLAWLINQSQQHAQASGSRARGQPSANFDEFDLAGRQPEAAR